MGVKNGRMPFHFFNLDKVIKPSLEYNFMDSGDTFGLGEENGKNRLEIRWEAWENIRLKGNGLWVLASVHS